MPRLAKLTVLNPPANVFVNPAWNLGARRATRPLLCLCNDDVTFDVDDLFGFVWSRRERLGSFGIHPDSFQGRAESAFPSLEGGDHIHRGWGCLLFLRRRDYPRIPDELRIWYGDDWIAAHVRPTGSIRTRVATEHSTTVKAPAFRERLRRDRAAWRARYRWRSWICDPPTVSRWIVRTARRRAASVPGLHRMLGPAWRWCVAPLRRRAKDA